MAHIYTSIGIIGSGAWGTALAQAARFAGRDALLFARDAELATSIATSKVNSSYLPTIKLDAGLRVTSNPADLKTCDALLLATPAQHLRDAATLIVPHIKPGVPVIICAKGIEITTGDLMHKVAGGILKNHPLAVLTGPNFANEVAQGLPAACVIASNDEALAQDLCLSLGSRTFRPYSSTDVVGAEIGGAIKNVLAIGCGVVLGKGLGENARAALVARGLAEMMRLAIACGGKSETLMGLSGLGDLVLTCSSAQSRNMSLGLALGQGRKLADVLAERHTVAEGVTTAKAALALARKYKVEMPLIEAVHAILHEGAEISATIEALLARPFKAEH